MKKVIFGLGATSVSGSVTCSGNSIIDVLLSCVTAAMGTSVFLESNVEVAKCL